MIFDGKVEIYDFGIRSYVEIGELMMNGVMCNICVQYSTKAVGDDGHCVITKARGGKVVWGNSAFSRAVLVSSLAQVMHAPTF